MSCKHHDTAFICAFPRPGNGASPQQQLLPLLLHMALAGIALAASVCNAAPVTEEAAITSLSSPITPAANAGAEQPMPAPDPAVTTEGYTCVVGLRRPQSCQMVIDAVNGEQRVRFIMPGQSVEFTGQRQGPWWSGALDGKPAMGYELNRGHVVYNTGELDNPFEWWSPGMEHGNY